MKRRSFLQSLLAVSGAVAIPSLASGSVRPSWASRSAGGLPPAIQHCMFFDYDDNLVFEGKFDATPRITMAVRHKFRYSDSHLTPAFDNAVFECVARGDLGSYVYQQVTGPRMPRRAYRI